MQVIATLKKSIKIQIVSFKCNHEEQDLADQQHIHMYTHTNTNRVRSTYESEHD